MTEPTFTCSKCGFVKVVTKNPESTERWFKKYHKCKAALTYRAGVDSYLYEIIKKYDRQRKLAD